MSARRGHRGRKPRRRAHAAHRCQLNRQLAVKDSTQPLAHWPTLDRPVTTCIVRVPPAAIFSRRSYAAAVPSLNLGSWLFPSVGHLALSLELMIDGSLSEVAQGRELLRLIERHVPEAVPEICDEFEPLRQRFDWDRLDRLWRPGGFLWRSGGRPIAAEGDVMQRSPATASRT
jgi:hypothetical protein